MSLGAEHSATEGQADKLDLLACMQAELLQEHDPRSYEYRQDAAALAALALEAGVDLTTLRDEETTETPPLAFTGVTHLKPLEVPASQFGHTILPLYKREAVYMADVVELKTDSGKRVRLVDLRPELVGRLDDIAPSPAEAAHLDSHFYGDLRRYVDTGWARNTVKGHGGRVHAYYTRVVSTKLRAFWGPIRAVGQDELRVPMIARFADSGNGSHKEIDLYRRLFGMTLRHVD